MEPDTEIFRQCKLPVALACSTRHEKFLKVGGEVFSHPFGEFLMRLCLPQDAEHGFEAFRVWL
jgi:hypothetical protein